MKFGIIALEEERISRLHWYNFSRYKITESFFLENYQVNAIAVYADKSLKNLHHVLADNEINLAVCTERFTKKFGEININGVEIMHGKSIYKRLLPKIIRKTIKISGIDINRGTLAISEENPSVALSLVENLCNDFRYITIIAKNKRKACEISEKILDEYGLPIVIADSGAKTKCDIAVKTGKELPNLSKNTILIDASSEHTITRKNSIDWVEISSFHNLPYKIDSLSFAECLEKVTGTVTDYKINGFRCASKPITTSMLVKKG